MTVFLTTLVLFLIALVLHITLWKIRLPKYHTRTLLIVFALVPGVWVATVSMARLGWPDVVHICLFYTSLSLCYVITYSAFEGDSPTLSLIRYVHQSRTIGMPPEEVRHFLETRPFVKARLNALIHDSLVREENGRYLVASNGSLFFRVILAFRKLYGSVEQGG